MSIISSPQLLSSLCNLTPGFVFLPFSEALVTGPSQSWWPQHQDASQVGLSHCLCHKSISRSVLKQKFSLSLNRQLQLGLLLLLQNGSWATSTYHFHPAYFILLHGPSLWKHAWSLLISSCATLQFLRLFELLSRELSREVFPLPLGRKEVACVASHYWLSR